MKLPKLIKEYEQRKKLIESKMEGATEAISEYMKYIKELAEELEEVIELIRILKEKR